MKEPARQAMHGIRVVDLSRVLSGPFCTMLLADHGADVVKVEQPGGDEARGFGPFRDGKSAYFASINRGKRSICLDLKSAADRPRFETLLENADVLVENFRPGVMERLGYGWETLHARYPRLVYGSISGFGRSGPLAGDRAYDILIQATSGLMSVTGQPGGRPTRAGVSVADLSSGVFLCLGVMMALFKRATTGVGSRVDTSLLDSALSLLEYPITRHLVTGEIPGPVGTYQPSIPPPFGSFRTADGELVVTASSDALFGRLCAAVGCDELRQDDRFASAASRRANEPELVRRLEEAFGSHGSEHWQRVLAEHDVPFAPIRTIDEVLRHPQVRDRSVMVEVVDEVAGNYEVVNSPIHISDSPPRRRFRAAPDLDQDRASILGDNRA